MFYRYSKDKGHKIPSKQFVNPYVTPLLSSSSTKYKCSTLNLNRQFIEPCSTPFLNNIYRTLISPVVYGSASRFNNYVTQISKKA